MIEIMVLLLGGLAGYGLYVLAETENAREREQWIESVGGAESPWVDPDVMAGELQRIYPDSQQPPVSAPVSEPVSTPVSAPASPPSPPAFTYDPQPLVPPAVEAAHLPTFPTSPTVVEVREVALLGDDWLEANGCFFPVALPELNPEGKSEIDRLNLAKDWISEGLKAGLTQTKIACVVFGTTKNSKAYKQIVQLIKEVRQ